MFVLGLKIVFAKIYYNCYVFFFFLDSPAKSPCKSSLKPSMGSSSFYGKQKSIYLTPLERKAIKESLPSPPLPSPPSQTKKPEKKNKKTVKGGNKLRKVSAGSSNEGRMGIKAYATSARTIKLSKLNSRFVYISVTAVTLVFLYL